MTISWIQGYNFCNGGVKVCQLERFLKNHSICQFPIRAIAPFKIYPSPMTIILHIKMGVRPRNLWALPTSTQLVFSNSFLPQYPKAVPVFTPTCRHQKACLIPHPFCQKHPHSAVSFTKRPASQASFLCLSSTETPSSSV